MVLAQQPAASSFSKAVDVRTPLVQTAPLVFSSPHSGRLYPSEFLTASKLDPLGLRRSEDSFVDEIFRAAPRQGAPLLRALFPRAYLDPNREPWELDPEMFDEPLPPFANTTSPRVREGFGTIARMVTGGAEIYREKLRFEAAASRVGRFYMPYHEALESLIAQTRERFGYAIVIDCHSMPSLDGVIGRFGRKRRPDFVLGDRYGTSCASALTERAEGVLTRLDYSVERNDPFAGAFIVSHYGMPKARVHALQIEVNRDLYLDEMRITRSPGFGALVSDLTELISRLAEIPVSELDA